MWGANSELSCAVDGEDQGTEVLQRLLLVFPLYPVSLKRTGNEMNQTLSLYPRPAQQQTACSKQILKPPILALTLHHKSQVTGLCPRDLGQKDQSPCSLNPHVTFCLVSVGVYPS